MWRRSSFAPIAEPVNQFLGVRNNHRQPLPHCFPADLQGVAKAREIKVWMALQPRQQTIYVFVEPFLIPGREYKQARNSLTRILDQVGLFVPLLQYDARIDAPGAEGIDERPTWNARG